MPWDLLHRAIQVACSPSAQEDVGSDRAASQEERAQCDPHQDPERCDCESSCVVVRRELGCSRSLRPANCVRLGPRAPSPPAPEVVCAVWLGREVDEREACSRAVRVARPAGLEQAPAPQEHAVCRRHGHDALAILEQREEMRADRAGRCGEVARRDVRRVDAAVRLASPIESVGKVPHALGAPGCHGARTEAIAAAFARVVARVEVGPVGQPVVAEEGQVGRVRVERVGRVVGQVHDVAAPRRQQGDLLVRVVGVQPAALPRVPHGLDGGVAAVARRLATAGLLVCKPDRVVLFVELVEAVCLGLLGGAALVARQAERHGDARAGGRERILGAEDRLKADRAGGLVVCAVCVGVGRVGLRGHVARAACGRAACGTRHEQASAHQARRGFPGRRAGVGVHEVNKKAARVPRHPDPRRLAHERAQRETDTGDCVTRALQAQGEGDDLGDQAEAGDAGRRLRVSRLHRHAQLLRRALNGTRLGELGGRRSIWVDDVDAVLVKARLVATGLSPHLEVSPQQVEERGVAVRHAARREAGARRIRGVCADRGLWRLAGLRGGSAEPPAAATEEGVVDEDCAARLVPLAHMPPSDDVAGLALVLTCVVEGAGAPVVDRAVRVLDYPAMEALWRALLGELCQCGC
eukprot:scaffold24159_cov68-Phaeocystis_antarctica.AAC.6